MTKNNILDALSGKLDNAQKIEEQRQKAEDFTRFARAYRERKSSDRGIWRNDYESGSILYKREGKPQRSEVGWLKASELAKLKHDGTITDIKIFPADKGKIAGSIYRALNKVALNGESRDEHAKVLFAQEAVSGMYLLGLVDNKTLLRMIEKGLKDGINHNVIQKIGEKFEEFGMIDDYHSDLLCTDTRVLRSVIQNKLRPEKQMTDEEAFQKGFDEACSAIGNSIWGDSVYSAKVEYKKNGEQRSGRIQFRSASNIASKIVSGEVTEVKLSPREKGKLYASVKRCIDILLDDSRDKPSWQVQRDSNSELFTTEAIAGLYILEKLNDQVTIDTFSHMLEKRPDLGQIVKTELSKYASS